MSLEQFEVQGLIEGHSGDSSLLVMGFEPATFEGQTYHHSEPQDPLETDEHYIPKVEVASLPSATPLAEDQAGIIWVHLVKLASG